MITCFAGRQDLKAFSSNNHLFWVAFFEVGLMETSSVFRMFAIYWFIFSILGLREADAEVLRLNSAVQEALSNSPKIQKAKSQYSEVEWKKIETYSGFLPNLSAIAS